LNTNCSNPIKIEYTVREERREKRREKKERIGGGSERHYIVGGGGGMKLYDRFLRYPGSAR
jgi:hypothetical protein